MWKWISLGFVVAACGHSPAQQVANTSASGATASNPDNVELTKLGVTLPGLRRAYPGLVVEESKHGATLVVGLLSVDIAETEPMTLEDWRRENPVVESRGTEQGFFAESQDRSTLRFYLHTQVTVQGRTLSCDWDMDDLLPESIEVATACEGMFANGKPR